MELTGPEAVKDGGSSWLCWEVKSITTLNSPWASQDSEKAGPNQSSLQLINTKIDSHQSVIKERALRTCRRCSLAVPPEPKSKWAAGRGRGGGARIKCRKLGLARDPAEALGNQE